MIDINGPGTFDSRAPETAVRLEKGDELDPKGDQTAPMVEDMLMGEEHKIQKVMPKEGDKSMPRSDTLKELPG